MQANSWVRSSSQTQLTPSKASVIFSTKNHSQHSLAHCPCARATAKSAVTCADNMTDNMPDKLVNMGSCSFLHRLTPEHSDKMQRRSGSAPPLGGRVAAKSTSYPFGPHMKLWGGGISCSMDKMHNLLISAPFDPGPSALARRNNALIGEQQRGGLRLPRRGCHQRSASSAR